MRIGNTIPMSQKALDYLWKQQEVTSDNIANVDTPGYKKKYVTFQDEFRNRIRAASMTKNPETMREAIGGAKYLTYSRTESARIDGNNVNIDVENTELARTTLHYQHVLQSLNSDITRYRTAIKGQ